jgi:tRNA A-37 threonylcarbamoyl transferase component Bud32
VANRALVVAGVALLVAGGGLAGYGVTRPAASTGPAPDASVMTRAVDQLDGDIKTARASVQSSARTIAGIQGVQAALSADKQTVEDNYKTGALAFQHDVGEVIELGIVEKKDGSIDPFLLQPPNAMRSSNAGKPGSYVELMGDHVLVTEVVQVIPLDHKDIQTGYVMVSKPLDLSPAFSALENAYVAGSLEIGGQSRAFGLLASGAKTEPMALSSVPGAKLVVATAPAASAAKTPPYTAGGGGIAGLGAILLVVGLVTGKRKPAEPVVPRTGLTPAQFGAAATQLSSTGVVGAGQTPSSLASDSTAFSSANLGAGATLGRWEIIKRLGSGGMADVYLAHARGEAGFAKQVAVKVMHPHLARNERAVEHFLDEARLAAQISHPNVVQIQDLGKIGNDYVIVMEYVDGVDLERLLASARAAQRQVPLDVGLGVLARICDGLEGAHRATTSDGQPMNLVHRDVKAANVLLSRQGTVKVVDFGIAKAAIQSHMTVAGETKGTPSMMAPEQRVGEQVDVRADVYSVAAVAYEILTGHNVNLDVAALAHLGIDNWPHLPLPSTQRAGLPVELDGVIMTALSFDRERRPVSCAALGASLEAVMKRHNMSATDKDIGRWVSGELDRLAA